jgi:hypothetical protein
MLQITTFQSAQQGKRLHREMPPALLHACGYLEEEFRRNTKALAQTSYVFLVEIALPAQDLRNDTRCFKYHRPDPFALIRAGP